MNWVRLHRVVAGLLVAVLTGTATAEIVDLPGTLRLPADRSGRVLRAGAPDGPGAREPLPRAALSGRMEVTGDRETFVRRLHAHQAGRLGLGEREVVLRDRRAAGDLVHQFYETTWRGLPVEGARLRCTFAATGDLLDLSLQAPEPIDLEALQPAVTLEQARALAWADAPAGSTGAPPLWRAGRLAVLPRSVSGLGEDRLIWRLSAARDHVGWQIAVDAVSGELLERRPLVLSAASGGLTGQVEILGTLPTPWGHEKLRPAAHQSVQLISGEQTIEQGVTLADGRFSLLSDPAPDLLLRAWLAGDHASIRLEAYDGPTPRLDLSAPAPGVRLAWDAESASPAAREAYLHVEAAHAWLKRVDPTFTALDRPVPVVVEDPGAHCNAFAYIDPADPWLRFLAGGGECTSTARLADVVYHEYGHLVTMYAYDPEGAPDELHEGFSDYFAASLADTSAVGLHLFGPDEPALRTLEHELTWPVSEGCAASPHCLGQLIAGALWDLRQGLIEDLGDPAAGVALADHLFHAMRCARPVDFDECLVLLLLQDDDDHDLANGTPHLERIAAAFARHNIGDFRVHLLHDPPPDTEDTTAAIVLEAAVRSIWPPAGVEVTYWLGDGQEQTAGMTATPGGDRLYRWTLPPQPAGTTLRYRLTARDAQGTTGSLPEGAAADRYAIEIGTDTRAPSIAHEPPGPPCTGQTGLWIAARIEDNSGRIGSAAVRGTVAGRAVEAELLPKAGAGDGAFEGFLATGSLGAGDTLRYHLSAADAAGTPNTARFPSLAEIALRPVPGSAWDCETLPEEFDLSGEWGWGAPAGGPGAAASGRALLGLRLDGIYYSPDTRSVLRLPDLHLTGWSHAVLEFAGWYRTEEGWDGGWIEASRDGGAQWSLVVPAENYPGEIPGTVWAGGVPAFTGDSGGWQRILVPLDAYAGGLLSLRFVFESDEMIGDAGWFIDDLKVSASQALIPPTGLTASSGEDRRVALAWLPPPGIVTSAPDFLGYNVYRGTQPDQLAPTPLNLAPHLSTWWYDSQVENGTRYHYRVTTVFDVGESSPSPTVVGHPYRPVLGELPAGGLQATLLGTPTACDTLAVGNAGTGRLDLDLYLADAEQPWEEVAPRFTLNEADAFLSVASDRAGDATGPDLVRLLARRLGGNLQLRVRFSAPLPDPATYTVGIFLDTDLRRSTGIAGPNVGGEHVVVLGADVLGRYAQPAVVVSATGEITLPSHVILQAGLDSIEVAVPIDAIGSPAQIGLAVALGCEGLLPEPEYLRASPGPRAWDPAGGLDYLPDPPGAATWLELSATSLRVEADSAGHLALRYDFTGRIEDEYRADLHLVSNDPSRPRVTLPVVVDLRDQAATGLLSWSAESRAAGLALAWEPDPADEVSAILLTRWTGALEEEEAAVLLTGGPIVAADGRTYTHLDRGVASGRRCYYRLRGITAAGDTLVYEPPAHPLYAPPGAAILALEAPRPNPFRAATLLRVRAPEDADWDLGIVDVGGRTVRRLVAAGALTGGTHLIAWDGDDDHGRPAATGVYFAVARMRGARVATTLLLIR